MPTILFTDVRDGDEKEVVKAALIARKSGFRVLFYTEHGEMIELPPHEKAPAKEGMYRPFFFSLRGLKNMALGNVIQHINAKKVVVLSPLGERKKLKMGNQDLYIIGGFTDGDYRSGVYGSGHEVVSISPEIMNIPDVVKELADGLKKKKKG